MFASDQAWIPPVGVLFVRILLAPWEHVVEFGYVHDSWPAEVFGETASEVGAILRGMKRRGESEKDR